MTTTPASALHLSKSVGIGGVTVRLHTSDPDYIEMLDQRYAGFPGTAGRADYDFEVELGDVTGNDPDADAELTREGRLWRLTRGDFEAEWDPAERRGRIRQSLRPYAIDSMLRIVHTLVLAPQGGILMHAASVVRHGKAYLFTGVSGAGKTTISRLAPPDATLLTDEISYVRWEEGRYFAHGTPFAGDLAKPGENIRASIGAIFLLQQGPENHIEDVPAPEAVRGVLSNTLFFAQDPALVQAVFQTACRIVENIPIKRLTFLPDERVWELIPGDIA
jgi:hypothetical protein